MTNFLKHRIRKSIDFYPLFFILFYISEPVMSQEPSPLFNTENLTANFDQKTQEALSLDDLSGALNYSYIITIPPGRNDLQPDLKLNYNNQQAGNIPNLLGYGWSINIPYINRINKSGTDKLYSDNYFFSSLSGELVYVSGSSYGSKVENGSFLTYTYDGTYWLVIDKKGTTYKFGETTASRQDNPDDNSDTYKWMLNEVRDANDNYIRYEYYKESGQIYPDQIIYTGNGQVDGIFKVEFLREPRPDISKSYSTSFLVSINSRISEIKVSIDETWVRKYALSYTTGDNGVRSLLDNIVESSRDESSNIVTLPATSFTYYEATPGWTLDTYTWTAPTKFNSGFQSMLDVNGDALPDVIESFHDALTSPSQKNIYINNNNGTWTVDTNFEPPILFREREVRGGAYQQVWDQGVRIGDVNGDFLPDIIKAEDNENGGGGYDAYLNTEGNSWTQDNTWHSVVTFNGDYNIHSWGSHFIDLNADGLLDIIRKQDTYWGRQINEGVSFSVEDSIIWSPSTVDLVGPKTRVVDLNGDNLPDLINMYWDETITGFEKNNYLNNGNGNWVLDNSGVWDLPVEIVTSANNYDSGARFFDVNADGLPDLVPDYGLTATGRHTHLNTGSGWISAPEWNVPEYVDIEFDSYNPVNIVDINTDGSLGFFTTHNSIPLVTKAYINNTTTPTDILKKITFSEGGHTTITYKNTPQYEDEFNNLLNPNLPLSISTVYQIVTSDGDSTSLTETYSYEGGEYYYNTWEDRKLAGFSKIIKTDSEGNKTINYYHQGSVSNSPLGEYNDHVSKIGHIYRIEKLDSLGNKYEVTVNKWKNHELDNDRNFVKLTRSTTLTYDGDTLHKDKSTTYTYDDTNGNLLQEVMWGEVAGSDDGSFIDIGIDKYTTDIAYASNIEANILALPKQKTITDQGGNKVRESKYYYDNMSFGEVTKGNLTKEEKWKTGTTYIDIEKTYDGTYGLVVSEKDPRDKITTYSYDLYNLYPTTVTNPLSQVVSYLYDYSLGKPKQITDVNGRVFQTVYDGLDRIIEEKQPDLDSPSSLVTKTAYTYTSQSLGIKTHKVDYLDSLNTVDTYTYTDGLGRLIQARKEMEDGNFATKDITYNSIGQIWKESLPYASGGTAKTPSTSNPDYLSVYLYDPMTRVVSTTNAIGTITNTYDDWKTTVTDLNGNIKHYYKDAYDNLVKVDEENEGNTYRTYYEWDGNNKLIKLTDALGNIRNFTYDGLGRRTIAEDLHNPTDTTFGTWNYVYDDADNLIQTIDPKSQITDYTYNDINQVITEDFLVEAGTEIIYTYGGCSEGEGRLCSVATSQGVNTGYNYNALGNTIGETKNISGEAYASSYTYDRQSNILEITNPDASIIKNIYNTAGQLETIQRKKSSDPSFLDVVLNFDYGPHRKLIKQKNANTTETIYTYDPTKMYRLTRILTNKLVDTQSERRFGQINLENFAQESPLRLCNLNLYGLRWYLLKQFPDVRYSQSLGYAPSLYLRQNQNLLTKIIKSFYSKSTVETSSQVKKSSSNCIYTPLGENEKGEEIIEAKLFTAPVNYFDSKTKKWMKIDANLVDKDKNWVISNAPFQVSVSKSIDDSFLTFTNKSNSISFSLLNLPEEPNIRGFLLEGSKVLYREALGVDIDIAITTTNNSVREETIIKKIGALGDLNGIEFYEIPFKITYDKNISLFDEKGNILTISNPITTSGEVILKDLYGVNIYLWVPIAVDKKGEVVQIEVRYELKDDGIYCTKLLPVSWLKKAIYPVVTDYIVSYQPDASGDGDISVTGTNWDVVHDQSTGYVHSTQTTANVLIQNLMHSIYVRNINRIALPINTSDIPDDASISDAKLKIYASSIYHGNDDGNDFIRVVQTTTASTSSLSAEDYDQIGAVNNPIAGADDYDLTGRSSGWQTITLNSTGLGWINKTGWTKLGLREGHDAVDQIPTINTVSGLTMYTSNYIGSGYLPYLEVTYTIPNQYPIEPTSLKTEGKINPGEVFDTNPEFTAIYNDPNPIDQAESYQIQVSTSMDFLSLLWDSGKQLFGTPVDEGNECPPISYGGASLKQDGSNYYWRIKFWDNDDTESPWSTEIATFTMYDEAIFVLQDLKYTYDNNGNIIRIIDTSETATAKIVDYTYDNLNRLTSATATSSCLDTLVLNNYMNSNTYRARIIASSGTISDSSNVAFLAVDSIDLLPGFTSISESEFTAKIKPCPDYTHSYIYNEIGNINSSPLGSYTYTGTDYANPHAVTSINGIPYTYDNNGNLLSDSTWNHTWNYKNKLIMSDNGNHTLTYIYDHNGSRTKFINTTETIITPSKYYGKEGLIDVKYIYAGDNLVATIRGTGEIDTIYYIHTDHLGSSAKTTDNHGRLIETKDYFPFGQPRISESTINNRKGYIGKDYDFDTGFAFLNARYYDGERGQFTSQDIVFQNLGVDERTEKALMDPQLMNSYSYGKGNPITLSDPDGEFIDIIADVGFTAYSGYQLINAIITGGDIKSEATNFALDAGGILVPGVAGLGTAKRSAKSVNNLVNTNRTFERLSDSAKVCRGGLCKGDSFISGKGVTLENGKLKGVSVNAGDVPTSELLKNIPHSKYGSTTVGEIRKLGGDVIRDVKNSYHSVMQGITPQQAETLFTPIKKNTLK